MSDSNDIDPMRMMREWFINSEKMWSDTLTDAMGDERFTKGMGKYMQEALHSQRMFSESMGQYLANLNMPSRADILDMNDRLSHMEETLNFVLVELREQRKLLASGTGDQSQAGTEKTAKKKPARTRKPSAKSSQES